MVGATFSFERLREHQLFQSLNEEEWQEFTTLLAPQPFHPSQTLFNEGDSTQELYILLKGVVELRRQFVRNPGDFLLATLHPGQLFGEMSILSGHRRSATAIAISDVETAVLSSKNLTQLPLSLQAKLYRSCAEMLSERLYWLDNMFTDLLEQRGAENIVSTMAMLHQRYQS